MISARRGPSLRSHDNWRTDREAVQSWPGVEAAPHRFGGVEFRVGRRELGHLHGDRIADLPFPRRVRDELIAEGRARPAPRAARLGLDHGLDRARAEEAEHAVELFRMAYERAREGAEEPVPDRARIFVVTGDEVVRLTLTGDRAPTMLETVLTVAAPRCVAVDPHDPNRVYVGTFDDGLYATDDGGETLARVVGRALATGA